MESLMSSHGLPLVTIVTPSYNQGRFIRETIESVLSQDYPHIEYLVFDGGSTDETLDILKGYDNRLFWISEPDRGQAHAINKGLKRAKGSLVAWLNSDDVYLAGAIAKAVTYLNENPRLGMAYGEAYHVDEHGRVIDRYPTELFDPQRLIETCHICQPATFMRREAIHEIGYLDESLQYCIDYDLWIRLSKKYPLGLIPSYLAHSRLHSDCKTIRQRIAAYKEAVEVLYRHYGFAPWSWLVGYAHVQLEGYRVRSRRWHNSFFICGMIALCSWRFVQYNSKMPVSELRRWLSGVYLSLKNLRDDRKSDL
jgi:glycosyltransferase involved in cell wall biosynthesis